MSKDIRTVVPNEFDFLRATSTNTPLSVTGVDKLIQIVTMELLSSPGRDIFNLSGGAGLRQVLPTGARQRTETGVLSDLSIALMRVEENIKARQDEEEVDPKARLASLILLDVQFDQPNATWNIVVRLTTESGAESEIPLVL